MPDDLSEPADSNASRPAGPLFDDPDELTDTGMMRRLALNTDGSLQTLIPPPRPVLPMSEAQPASAGRRFSADDAPHDVAWAAPRRSAVSVSSPPSAYEPILGPVSRPTAPPSVTVNYTTAEQPAVSDTAPLAPTAPPTRRSAASARSQATPPMRAAAPEPKVSAREARAAAAAAKAEEKAAREAEKAAEKEAARQAKLDAKSARADAKAAKAGGRAKAPSRGVDAAARLGIDPAQQPGASSAPPSSPRSLRPALIVIAAVAAIAVVVAGVVVAIGNNTFGGGGPVAETPVEPLLTPAEVAPLSATNWQETPVSGNPICLDAVTPAPDRTSSRKLATTSNDSVLQVISNYPDESSAMQAYQANLTQAGTCPNGEALVVAASEIKGLADQAQAIQLRAQGTKAVNHLLVLTRTGRTINAFDIVTAETAPVTTAAQVAATSLSRQCDSGTCPSALSVASTLPAPGNPAGWLVPADLPLLTAGTGKWTLHDWPVVNSLGSQCEDTDLTKITDTTAAGQRTLVLTNDPKAPTAFGVDQVSYTFASNKAASALATKLDKAISTCSTRVPTASIDEGASVKGTGQGGVAISGASWKVTHKTNTGTVVFRVSVITVGTRVTYVLGSTTNKSFDFSDSEWSAIALRAAERTSQAG